jgi:arylsulfatase A-like enzyme
MPVPFRFRRHGRSGLEVSELLPRLSAYADDLCVLRSLHTDNPNHGPALFLMNNGSVTPTRPSMGAWLSYGLGTENADLPAFVVLCPGRPVRFAELWSSGFLPAEHQGTYVNHTDLDPRRMLPYLRNAALTPEAQRRQLDLMRRLNEGHADDRGGDPALEARIRSMETAYRMQAEATDAFDVAREPERVRDHYGRSHFANACLLARRLTERGVRFVQVYYGNGQPWDTHRTHNESTRTLCADIDRPIAALLGDLKARGLLDDTLVVWGGEFGRTPTSESGNGRDHNHWGFTMWLAGGGVRGGMAYGTSDEFGFRAAEDRMHVHDLHATLLHLLGFDHERLTYRHAGRDFRLTDVYGRVVREIMT